MPSLAKFTSHYFPNFSIVESVLSLKLFARLTTHSKSNIRSFSIVNARKRLGSESDENLRKKASANGREREVEMGEDTLFEIEMGDLGRGQNQVKIISGNMNGRTDVKLAVCSKPVQVVQFSLGPCETGWVDSPLIMLSARCFLALKKGNLKDSTGLFSDFKSQMHKQVFSPKILAGPTPDFEWSSTSSGQGKIIL
ncbi:hypothetical protein ABEW05_011618 [Botrytis cinerea]